MDEDGGPKATAQLANACAAIHKGLVPSAAGAQARGAAAAVLYPIVIVADPSMEAFAVNSVVNDVFQKEIAPWVHNVRPLTIMSIQELEEVLAYTAAGAFTWPELLDSRFQRATENASARSGLTRVVVWSVHQAIYNLITQKGIPSIPNQFRRSHFERISSSILARYTGQPSEAPRV